MLYYYGCISMHTKAEKFPWAEEFERTVVHSLATSFSLDFLLFKDKLGGEVDTVHNSRAGIWATEGEKEKYEQRKEYKILKENDSYHSHENYKATGARDKELKKDGKLHDAYRNTIMKAEETRNLDHVISAYEIHNDAGRVLSELDGRELANQSSNLQTTAESINKSKQQSPVESYLEGLPKLLERHEAKLISDNEKLSSMPYETPEQRHNLEKLKAEIKNAENKIEKLKSIDVKGMRKRDEEARSAYNQQVNKEYYSSSKFLEQAASASALSGMKMGVRQMLGLIMAEMWFELRAQLPNIFQKIKTNFKLEEFIEDVKETLKGIWKRVQLRFKDFLMSFGGGVFSGALSSATTTLFNIFATTQKMAIKLIREIWGQLVKVIKLMVFNPDKLSFVDLCRAALAIISVAVATSIGTIIYTQLLPLCSFPFGSALASFLSALVTGIITLGLNYFLLYSDMAKKLWCFVESIMPHAGTVKQYQAINAELDRYLLELGRLEFGMDADELDVFSIELAACNNETQCSILLNEEVIKRGIELPFEMGNSESTRKWLGSLV